MTELYQSLILVLTPENLMFCFLGCLLGTLVGILPGVGPTLTISILLPLTYSLNPVVSIMMLAGIYYGSQYGSSTTSILLNLPGEPSSMITCIDGYQMTKNGLAGQAIFAAGVASFIGGCISVIIMVFVSVPASMLSFKFGPAEYTMLILMALLGSATVVSKRFSLGLISLLIGMLIGTIGTDANTGVERFVFGIPELYDGIDFIILVSGLFGVTEVLKNLLSTPPTSKLACTVSWWSKPIEWRRIIPSAIRGSLVGSLIGVIPGGGMSLASYLSYIFEKRFSKNKNLIGKGAVEGVAAPEAANNAAAQAGFIPLLTLGIPENITMAIFVGALIMYGIEPGPMLIEKNPELFWGLAFSMIIGNVFLTILNIPLIGVWVKVLKIPQGILNLIILVICVGGVYLLHQDLGDVVMVLLIGVIGLVFQKLDLSYFNIIMGAIMGPILEENFRRQLILGQGDLWTFVSRPISASLFVVICCILVYSLLKFKKQKNYLEISNEKN